MSAADGPSHLRERQSSDRVLLPNDACSVKVARDEVALMLTAAGWCPDAVERARIVTSELATNAIVHAGTAFELGLRFEGVEQEVATIEVADGVGDEIPRYAERGQLRPGGMGLYLVDALAHSWGVDLDDEGKVVWACLRADAPPASRR